LVDYTFDKIFIRFFNSKKWQPIYYGSAAAVFVKKPFETVYSLKSVSLERFDRLGNLEKAGKVFTIAMNFDDIDAAEYILDNIRKKFKRIKGYQKIITDAGNKIDGLKAYQTKEYDTAFHLLSRSDDQTVVKVTQTLIHLRVLKSKQMAAEKKYSQALELLEDNLKRLPNHPDFLYAAGVMAYFSQNKARTNTSRVNQYFSNNDSRGYNRKFKKYFNEFISRYPNHLHADVARQILENRPNLSIPLGL